MTELHGRLTTGTGGPAWGEGHLALDAIVAYVDEELSDGAHRRALEHLARCPECASEVVAQTQARLMLRASPMPSMSTSLLHSLQHIPSCAELPEPPAGLSMSPTGELVELQRRPANRRRRAPYRRVRLGAGAVVSGLAVGALIVGGNIPTSPGSTASATPRAVLVAPRHPVQSPMAPRDWRSAQDVHMPQDVHMQSAMLDAITPSRASHPLVVQPSMSVRPSASAPTR